MTREVIEVTPLASQPASAAASYRYHAILRFFKVLSLISLWYLLSTTLSVTNKHLIGSKGLNGKGKFPAPLLMTGLQFFVQFIMCRLFLDLELVDRTDRPDEDRTWTTYSRTVVPNGVSTGLDIGFSNLSLRTISLSFYTMCKSTTPMFLLAFAFIWKLETPSWTLAGIMMVISGGIVLLVFGETKFSLIGFMLVMSASCLAGFRWTLTQLFLQGNNTPTRKHNEQSPLELLEKLTPIMSVVVIFVSLLCESWHRLSYSPYFEDFQATMNSFAIIIIIGIIAFLMVWTEFKVIQETSALTFMVAGTCKEVVTVLAAVIFFHDEFGAINGLGLVVLLFGVSLFNVHKYNKLNSATKNAAHRVAPSKSGKSHELTRIKQETED